MAACTGTRPGSSTSLRVGYTNFKPYVGVGEHGIPAGLAVDILAHAARRAGIRLQWVRKDDPEDALRRNEIDLYPIFTVTADRQREFHMSVPWWEYSQLLLSRKDRPLRGAADTIGRQIAIRDLSHAITVARAVMPGAVLAPRAEVPSMVAELCQGRVDGALVEGRLLFAALMEQPAACQGHQLESYPLPGSVSQMASISTQAAARPADLVFDAIQDMVADGTLTEIANRWFFMPQQRSVRQRLIERDRWHLELLYAAALVLLLAGVRFWLRARALRRAADQALAKAGEAERRFEAFMAHSPAISLLKNPDGRILYCNRAFEKAHGVAAQDAVGRTDADIWPPETSPRCACTMPRCCAPAIRGSTCSRFPIPVAASAICWC